MEASRSIDKPVAVVGVSAISRKGSPHVNTGNLMHAIAGRNLLGKQYEMSATSPWTDEDIERIQSDCSHIVYVAANGLRIGNFDDALTRVHEVTADNFEKAQMPIVVLGLGSQAPLNFEGAVQLPDSTMRLVNALSAHSHSIGVRGAFTAEILNSLGIKNSWVTGCPSCFWHHTPHFTQPISEVSDTSRVVFNYTGPWMERLLLRLATVNKLDMVGQQQFAEEAVRDQVRDGPEFPEGMLKVFADQIIDRHAYSEYVKDHFYQFYDLAEWMQFLRSYQFSFGTRFHGNMAALQMGVRSLWIVHDRRTEELCDALNLPSVRLPSITAETTLEELIDAADYGEFVRKYPDAYANFYAYLQANQLRTKLPRPHQPSTDTTTKAFDASSAIVDALQDRIDKLDGRSIEIYEAIGRLGRMISNTQTGAMRAPGNGDLGDAVQVRNNTEPDRYPSVFADTAAILSELANDRGLRILSFGCSSGDEVFTLADRYFTRPDDRIVGVDISKEMLEQAVHANRFRDRVSFELSSSETIAEHGPYDVIFAMSVLCVWPDTKDLEDISSVFPFAKFESMVRMLDSNLSPGGLLVIFNSNFCFEDLNLSENYEVQQISSRGSGFVKKFQPDNQAYPEDFIYHPVIFRKNPAK